MNIVQFSGCRLAALTACLILPIAIAPATAHGQSHFATVRTGQRVGVAGSPRMLDRQATPDTQPWVEGVDPKLENQLFWVTYRALPDHNVLKVYAIDANGYESAGIRFSARVPHEQSDLSADEIDSEAVTIIRSTFDRFPKVQTVDVWGTIPVPPSRMHSVEDTVFSISADRSVYEDIRNAQMSDGAFLSAFGRVWLAPQVPR